MFTDDGALPGAPEHHYAALVAADQRPGLGRRRRRPAARTAARSPATSARPDGTSLPSACDDGPFGKGTGGELRYRVTSRRGGSKTLWVAAAGSDKGLAAARPSSAGALRDPAGAFARQDRRARRARARSQCRCPATACSRTRSSGASRTSPT